MVRVVLIAGLILLVIAVTFGDGTVMSYADLDQPAIQYNSQTLHDPGTQLNRKIQFGEVHLKFDGPQGYLRSVLDALDVPIQSQLVVFSKTSFQADRINPRNPRSLFFSDSVVVGWVHGGPIIEVAAEDPKQGMIFYTLSQNPARQVRLSRDINCLACHVSYATLGVPGTLMRSVFPEPDGATVSGSEQYLTEDRSPFAQRWGGWYVTGSTGWMPHMGNSVVNKAGKLQPMSPGQGSNLESLQGHFDTAAYLSPYSDVVALMVFEHQMHMMNLFTRAGWDVRRSSYRDEMNPEKGHAATDRLVRQTARELVDYMLFVDEAPMTSRVEGTSGFAEKFSSEGPTDRQGRSLRQFDLQHRLMRYPCSYMIYSDAFDALPDEVKSAVYERMWKILSGQEKEKYGRLTFADRKDIVEILRDTKKRLPDYFKPITR
ncbi:MAG TPA: hypothetical protein VIY66_07660 [Candidatus Acidoferrales bacterium]